MKIYLSKDYQACRIFCILFILSIIIGDVVYCLYFGLDVASILFVLCSLYFVLATAVVILCSYRFLTYVIVNDHIFDSFSATGKKMCSVDTSMPVYYAIFDTSVGRIMQRFIAISNSSFEYQPTYGKKKTKFIMHYDTKKQIVIPYNPKTMRLFDIEKWYNVQYHY